MKICMISFGPVETRSNGYFIRCYHIAKSLVKLGHEVHVLQFPEKKTSNLEGSREGIEFINLQGNEVSRNKFSRMLKNTLTFDLFHSIRFQLYSLNELIRYKDRFKDSDIVFVEGALILFGIIIPKIFRKKVILDTHCINKLLALHFMDRNFFVYRVRKVLWDILERFSTKLSDAVIVVSERERDFIQTEYGIPESNIFVVPNVIEIQRRNHSKRELVSLKKKWNLKDKIIITFVGNLESVQNYDAVEYIINDLALFFIEKRKEVTFLIIGKGKENFKRKLPNVIFTGFVKDLAPYIGISDICIAPLRVGAGVKTKILMYVVHGKPVITTPIGVEGVKLDELDFVIVTSITQFANTLLKALDILNDLKQKARKSQLIAKSMYSTDTMEQELKKVLEHVA